ncbi:MAG: kelch motif-containing protein [Candidatus Bathyarchaeota archaeon]|nr:kelch motif-containing protein [Candidatus Termiticorpusculum sp.]
MPTARANFAIAVYEGKIYCIGGGIVANYSDSYYEPPPPVEFSVNEVYDPITDSWSVKASSQLMEVIFGRMLLMGKFLF